MTGRTTETNMPVSADEKARLTAELLSRLKTRDRDHPHNELANFAAAVFGFVMTPHAAWMTAGVCLALSAGDAYGRGMGLLVGGILAAATAGIRAAGKS